MRGGIPRRRAGAAALVAVVAAASIAAVVAQPSAAGAAPRRHQAPKPVPAVPVTAWKGAIRVTPSPRPSPTPSPSRLTAGSWTVALASTASARAGVPAQNASASGAAEGTFASVGASGLAVAAVSGGSTSSAMAGSVRVSVLDAATAKTHGLSGLTLQIDRLDNSASPIAVSVPTSVIKGLYGADYATRVHWLQIPATGTPGVASPSTPAASAKQTPSAAQATLDAARAATVLTTTLPSKSVLLTAAGGPISGGGAGAFSSTPLNASGTWAVNQQSGDFTWSYPMRVPPVAAGPQTGVSLDYDSQSVDGETGSTNNQPSSVGDGWSLDAGGSIDRAYTSCSMDQTNPVASSGDLCFAGNDVTLNLGGQVEKIIRNNADSSWKLQSDDGTQVAYLTGTNNGTFDGDYWRLTRTDGTQYYFGMNRLPNWATGNSVTNSVYTVPVYGNDLGEPCHQSTFAASSCVQAWRWNLDYVVDPHNNAEALYYNTETNYYAQNGSTTTSTSYVRGGEISRIDYGLSSTTVYAANAASSQVSFAYADRCAYPANCTPTNPSNYPDVPWDQSCTTTTGSPPTCSGLVSPTFWSTQMLSSVTTKVKSGGAYAVVDSWTLGHDLTISLDTNNPALWLSTIDHTGSVGGTASVPQTSFGHVALQNRVFAGGLSKLDRLRISSITTETGATITPHYSDQQCTAGTQTDVNNLVAAANTSTSRCYPAWYTPQIVPAQAGQMDMFHKYVLTSVVSSPVTGGTQDLATETDYFYGTPRWRYNTAAETPTAQRTWSIFAGYNTVEVRTGANTGPQTSTLYTYFQGMNGDRASASGGSKPFSVSASDGSSVTDSFWLAGRVREVNSLTGVSGSSLNDVITTPWASAVTANDGSGVDPGTARVVADGESVTRQPLSTGGTRTVDITTGHDTYGRPTTVNTARSDAAATCSTTTYPSTTATTAIKSLPSEVAVVGVACANVSTATYPAAAISDVRTGYDNLAVGATPTLGDATTEQTVTGYTGTTASTATWLTTATNVYDALGRLTKTTDQLSRVTQTAYTPTTGGPLTQSVVTNPLNWTTTTAYQPAWGLPTSVTDQNNHVTSGAYDPLGRLASVWTPDNPQSANPPTPSTTYAYSESLTQPSTVVTTTIAPLGPITTYSLYDGLGRLRQTQVSPPGGGILLTDTNYDSAGRVNHVTNPYFSTGNPSGTLLVPGNPITLVVPGWVDSTYDTAGRKTADITYVNSAEAWRTSYSYSGADRVNLTPPSGGAATSTITNSLGSTTSLTQWLSATPGTGTSEATTYGYNARGDLTAMTDPAGNQWSWNYDALDRQTSATDPDTGTTAIGYDTANRVSSTTDARSQVLAYTYDSLDRKTGEYSGSTSGPKLDAWTYDTLDKGQLTSATSYVGSTSSVLGTPYTKTITGYDAMDRATGQSVVIPAAAGALAGTYTNGATYSVGGYPNTITDPAEGGIPAETMTVGYGSNGDIAGYSATNAGSYYASYLDSATYSNLNQLSQTDQSTGTIFFRDYSRDLATNRLIEVNSNTNAAQNATPVDETYTYNAAGNITQDTSVRDTGAATDATTTAVTDTQCYTYDYQQNLTQAWTPASNNCGDTPTTSNQGGPAPYWTNYTLSPTTGNRTATTRHSNTVTGFTSVTDALTYPAATAAQPHAVSSITRTGSATLNYTYDAAGHTKTRPGQTLTWNADGRLATLTTSGGTETDTYDADGNLLLQANTATGTTLYVGDTVLHVNTGSSTTTAVRTYTLPGIGTLAERTGTSGVTGTTLYWTITNPQDTVLALIATATGKVTQRYYDPYGNPRGAAPSWPNTLGFLNAPTTTTSGLTHLGARDYDPVTGRFESVDPLLELGDPQQVNGFGYAANDPINGSDPSGLANGGDDREDDLPGPGMSGSLEDGDYAGEVKSAQAHEYQGDPTYEHDFENEYGEDNAVAESGWNANRDANEQKSEQAAAREQNQRNRNAASETNTQSRRSTGSASNRSGVTRGNDRTSRSSSAANRGARGLPKSGTIEPSAVRFSQNSVSSTFSDGRSVQQLATDLEDGVVGPDSIPPIRIFEQDGNLYTLDNRRLLAFQQAGIDIPYRLATPREILNQQWKFTTTNDGTSILIRGAGG